MIWWIGSLIFGLALGATLHFNPPAGLIALGGVIYLLVRALSRRS